MNIKMDTGRDDLLTDYATGMLKDFYLRPEEDSPQEGYARAAIAWSSYKGVLDEALAQRLYDYVSKKWFMFASHKYTSCENRLGKPFVEQLNGNKTTINKP